MVKFKFNVLQLGRFFYDSGLVYVKEVIPDKKIVVFGVGEYWDEHEVIVYTENGLHLECECTFCSNKGEKYLYLCGRKSAVLLYIMMKKGVLEYKREKRDVSGEREPEKEEMSELQ